MNRSQFYAQLEREGFEAYPIGEHLCYRDISGETTGIWEPSRNRDYASTINWLVEKRHQRIEQNEKAAQVKFVPLAQRQAEMAEVMI